MVCLWHQKCCDILNLRHTIVTDGGLEHGEEHVTMTQTTPLYVTIHLATPLIDSSTYTGIIKDTAL